MKRRDIEKAIRRIAKTKGVEVTFEEGTNHTIVRFDDRKVTLLPRHNEINELTARGAIKTAENWTEQD